MKSVYQIEQEMMAAWLKWVRAQEEADRAKAEYDRAAVEMKKCLEEAKSHRHRNSDGQPHQNTTNTGGMKYYSVTAPAAGRKEVDAYDKCNENSQFIYAESCVRLSFSASRQTYSSHQRQEIQCRLPRLSG